jgi:hypothetical protein
MVIIVLATNGDCLMKRFRVKKKVTNELIVYAAINVTIVIFHLGGATIASKSGSVNHISRPVAFS